MKVLLDSSGWIEFFSGGPLADRYESYLKDPSRLVTPTIVLHEVYKVLKRERGEEIALIAIASMGATRVLPLTDAIALRAADLSLQRRLGMADAIVYATSREEEARVVTGDADLKDLPDVASGHDGLTRSKRRDPPGSPAGPGDVQWCRVVPGDMGRAEAC